MNRRTFIQTLATALAVVGLGRRATEEASIAPEPFDAEDLGREFEGYVAPIRDLYPSVVIEHETAGIGSTFTIETTGEMWPEEYRGRAVGCPVVQVIDDPAGWRAVEVALPGHPRFTGWRERPGCTPAPRREEPAP